MKCPDCGAENQDDAKKCVNCGRPIEWWRIRVKGRVGKLSPQVLAVLDVIPKTHRGKIPAVAALVDGSRFPCTLFLEVTDQTGDEYFSPVGMLRTDYEFDEKTRRRVIQPESVSSVVESPFRTPISLETKMYADSFREIYMDAPFVCRLILDDGSEYLMERPDWDTEFIVLPGEMPNERISDVLPVSWVTDIRRLEDAGRELPDPGVKYCLFRR